MISKKLLISAIAVTSFFIFTLLVILEQQKIAEIERLSQLPLSDLLLHPRAADGPPVFLHTIEIPPKLHPESTDIFQNVTKELAINKP